MFRLWEHQRQRSTSRQDDFTSRSRSSCYRVHRTRRRRSQSACVRACVPRSPLLDSSFLSSSSGTIASGRLSRLPTITRGYISHRKSRTKDRPAGVLTPRSSVSSIVPPTRRPLPCLLRARSRPRCRTCCPPPPSPPPYLSSRSIDLYLIVHWQISWEFWWSDFCGSFSLFFFNFETCFEGCFIRDGGCCWRRNRVDYLSHLFEEFVLSRQVI